MHLSLGSCIRHFVLEKFFWNRNLEAMRSPIKNNNATNVSREIYLSTQNTVLSLKVGHFFICKFLFIRRLAYLKLVCLLVQVWNLKYSHSKRIFTRFYKFHRRAYFAHN